MRTPAQLRRDLQDIVDDLPRVLAQDMTAEERREYERAGRRARLRLFWLRPGGARRLTCGCCSAGCCCALHADLNRGPLPAVCGEHREVLS